MKKLKEEKGSITLFVLISMLFFVLILAGMYMLNMAKEEAGVSQTAKIKEIYEKDVNQIDNVYETLTNVQTVNVPVYKNSGLIPVTIQADGSLNIADTTNNDWYSYDGEKNQWANAKTDDGSMFVWIPRFAYKITYTDINDKSKGGTIDVVFLKGKTNFDFKGNDVTSSSYVDENGVTGAYVVHPAFKNGKSNGYANGEWNSEIEGFWMAKFEAGYEGTAGDETTATDSEVGYSTIYSWDGNEMADKDTNYYGTRAEGTLIKYPVFQANKASMNYIGISDAYDLCQNMTSSKAPYKLTSIVKPHLTKNSEWGAVAYLTHSKYGRNGSEVTINNINLEGVNTLHGVTGYAAESVSADVVTTTLAQIQNATQAGSWTTSQGQKASTTGNIYGIYDLSGGNWEWTAGYIVNTTYTKYSGSLKGQSNQYESKYTSDTSSYSADPNPTRLGEAIWETSTSGEGSTSWYNDNSVFPDTTWPFFVRGGAYYKTTESGLFNFFYNTGCCHFSIGFRPVLIIE